MDKKAPGFTLIEVVLVLAIMGFLASMAAPTFAGFVASSRLRLAVDVLQTMTEEGLSQARSTQAFWVVSGTADDNTLRSYQCAQTVDPIRDNACEPCVVVRTESLSELAPGVDLVQNFAAWYSPPRAQVTLLDTADHAVVLSDMGQNGTCATLPTGDAIADITLTYNDTAAPHTLHGMTGLLEPVTAQTP